MKNVSLKFMTLRRNKFCNYRATAINYLSGICLNLFTVACFAQTTLSTNQSLPSVSVHNHTFETFRNHSATEFVYSARLNTGTFFTLSTKRNPEWDGLWRKRQNKMILVKNLRNAGELIAVNNSLYFVAQNAEFGTELWKSDGSARGTSLVKDINLGALGSQPNYLIRFNQGVLFFAKDNQEQVNLWYSEGDAKNTVMVKHFTRERFPDMKEMQGHWSKWFNSAYQVFDRRIYASKKQSDIRFIMLEASSPVVTAMPLDIYLPKMNPSKGQ